MGLFRTRPCSSSANTVIPTPLAASGAAVISYGTSSRLDHPELHTRRRPPQEWHHRQRHHQEWKGHRGIVLTPTPTTSFPVRAQLRHEPSLRGVPLPLPWKELSYNHGEVFPLGPPAQRRGISFIRRKG